MARKKKSPLDREAVAAVNKRYYLRHHAKRHEVKRLRKVAADADKAILAVRGIRWPRENVDGLTVAFLSLERSLAAL